jgi:hypothetical protein
MEVLGDKNTSKNINNFCCEFCDFKCCKLGDWKRHILTPKHIKVTPGDYLGDKKNIKSQYTCGICQKSYESRNGLWKHKQKCKEEDSDDDLDNEYIKPDEPTDKELIMMLMKKNDELQSMMMEVIKNGTNNTINSHNKSFNLNFFLNETCKDAMNIMDFVDSIKLQLSDLEKVGELGYVAGISNIIVKNLKELDVTKRPVHCTDKKRETLYIKDEDKWEKDDEKKKLRKVIKRVASKNQRLLLKFKEVHPDCGTSSSKYSDQYNTIIVESMGGSGDNDLEKEEKIMRNILKQIVVDK